MNSGEHDGQPQTLFTEVESASDDRRPDTSESSDDKLRTLSKVWDALSTYERFKILAHLCVLSAAVAGGAYWLAQLTTDMPDLSGLQQGLDSVKSSGLANTKSIGENKRSAESLSKRVTLLEERLEQATTLYPETVATHEDAVTDRMTVSEYRKEMDDLIGGRDASDLTRQEQVEFNKRFANHKIEWTAFVMSASKNEFSLGRQNYVIQVSDARPDVSKPTRAIHATVDWAYFQRGGWLQQVQSEPRPDDDRSIEQLLVGQRIRFAAVFDGRGVLYRFKLLEVNPR